MLDRSHECIVTQWKGQNKGSVVMKFTISVDPYLVIITTYVVKTIYKKRMHFHNMTYMAKPPTRTPAPGVMKFKILVDPSLVIITTYLVCLIYARE